MIVIFFLFFIIVNQCVFASKAKVYTPFALFNDENVPSKIKIDKLGVIESRKLGLASKNILNDKESKWSDSTMNPFSLPKAALTFLINGLTTDDAKFLTNYHSNVPQNHAQLATYYSSAFYKDFLGGRQHLIQSNVELIASAEECSAAHALTGNFDMNRQHQGFFCAENQNDVDDFLSLVKELNTFFELKEFNVVLNCDSKLNQCTLNDNETKLTISKNVEVLLRELVLSTRATQSSLTDVVDITRPSITCLITQLNSFNNEERQLVLNLIAAIISTSGCTPSVERAGVVCSIVGVAPHNHAKRAIFDGDAKPWNAYTFHLLLWVSISLALISGFVACVMHSIYNDTEKDALLFRTTTKDIFKNSLDLH